MFLLSILELLSYSVEGFSGLLCGLMEFCGRCRKLRYLVAWTLAESPKCLLHNYPHPPGTYYLGPCGL